MHAISLYTFSRHITPAQGLKSWSLQLFCAALLQPTVNRFWIATGYRTSRDASAGRALCRGPLAPRSPTRRGPPSARRARATSAGAAHYFPGRFGPHADLWNSSPQCVQYRLPPTFAFCPFQSCRRVEEDLHATATAWGR